MCSNDFKRTQMSIIPYSFCQHSANSHLRVLNRIRDFISIDHKDQYITIVNDLLEFDYIEEEQFLWGNPDMYDFYYNVAKKGLYFISPVSRTKSLSILSQLAPCSIRPIFQLLPSIKKMVNSDYWELKGQILILSNCAIEEMVNDKEKLDNSG